MNRRTQEEERVRSRGATGQLATAAAAVSGAGGALVATATIAASACCAGPVLAPLVVGILGASGAAWAAGLKPYSPWLLAGSLGMLAFGFWSSYRTPRSCESSGVEPAGRGLLNPLSQRLVRAILWLSALLWVAATAVNLFIPS